MVVLNRILIKRQADADNAAEDPDDGELIEGELGINTKGGLIWYGDDSDETQKFKITAFGGSNWSIPMTNGSGVMTEVGHGAEDYVLTSTGTGTAPTWQAAGGSANDATITLTSGTGMTGGAAFTTDQSSNETITLNVVGGDGITANANDMEVTPAQTTITSLLATDIKIGEDDQTKIDFETANTINFYLNNAKDFSMSANTFTAESGSSIVVPASGLTIGSTAVTSTAAELNLLDGVSGLVQADLTKLAATDASAAEIDAACDASGRTAGTVVVADDFFYFADGSATGALKIEAISDFVNLIDGTGLSASSGVLSVDAAQTQITSVGTIGTGTWQGGVIDNDYLDSDTAHLSTTQTFSGGKTFTEVVTMGGNLPKQLQIQYDGSNYLAFAIAADGGTTITTAGTDDEMTFTTPTATFSADVVAGKLTIDTNMVFNGTKIAMNSGTLELDSAVDIDLDAGGGDIFFKSAGTTFGSATNTSGNLIIKSGTTTALTFSGADVTVAGDLTIDGSITLGATSFGDADITNVGSIALDTIINDGTDITLDSSADIVIDAAGGNIEFKDAGTLQLTLDMDGTSGAQVFQLGVNGDDLAFNNYDGNLIMTLYDNENVQIDNNLVLRDTGLLQAGVSGVSTDLELRSYAGDINLRVGGISNEVNIQKSDGSATAFSFNGANSTAKYLNFSSNSGSSGYGFKDNNGTMQVKNTGGAWANFGASGGEANVNAYGHVAVSGQTTCDADQDGDTLTFVAGSNMTITTSGDDISFVSSGGTTDLTKSVSGSAYSINSSSGDNIALSLADTDNWGLMSDEMFDTLAAATTNTGTVTSVDDGNGLTGGAITSSGSLAVGAGTGITVNTNDVAVTAAQTGITSVVNTSLEIGRDADNRIKFGTDNQIIFEVSGGDNVIFKASGEIEATSLDIGSGGVDVNGTLETNTLTVGGTNVLTGSLITTLGTISSGVWNGTAIASGYIADNSITLAKLAGGTDGNIISFDASGNPVAIATGSDGQVLTSAGAGQPPAFEDASGGGSGDIEGVTAGDGLQDGGTSGTVTLNIDVSDFAGDGLRDAGSENLALDIHNMATTGTTVHATQDYFVYSDGGSGNEKKITPANINLSVFNNDSGWTTNTGTTTASNSQTFTNKLWNGTALTHAYIGADAITAAKIGDNVINSEHYAADSIDAEHYAAGSVDATALGADCVTAAKIGDNVLNSEHYAAASIDNEHLADNAVDTAEIADNAVTLAKMASGTDGNIISYDASGNPVAIATGTDGQVLTSTGAGSPPAFEDAAGGGGGGGDDWGDDVDAHIKPASGDSGTYNLGSATEQFGDGFFHGTLEADAYSADGNAGVSTGGFAVTGNPPDLFALEFTQGICTAYANMSDSSVKENITSFTESGLDFINNKVDLKSFNFKESFLTARNINSYGTPKNYMIGVIAQDVEAIDASYMELDNEGYKKPSQKYKMEYNAAIINAIKELSAKNDALEARLAILEAA